MICADHENNLSRDNQDIGNIASDLLDPDMMRGTLLSRLLAEDFSKVLSNATAKDLLQASYPSVQPRILVRKQFRFFCRVTIKPSHVSLSL